MRITNDETALRALEVVAQMLEDAAQDFDGPWGTTPDPAPIVTYAANEIRAAVKALVDL